MLPNFEGIPISLWLASAGQISGPSSGLVAWARRCARICVERGGITQAWLGQVDSNQSVLWIAGWPESPAQYAVPAELLDQAANTGQPVTFRDHHEIVSGGLFPLVYKERVIGLLSLISDQTDYFRTGTVTWISAFASSISEDLLQEESWGKTRQAEYSIGRILQSSLDVRDALPSVLKIVVDVLEADAITALRCNFPSKRFDLLAAHGLDARQLAKLNLYFEAGLAGRALEQSHPIWIEDLLATETVSRSIRQLTQEGFRGYLALPLIGHNDLLGVLEIVWRAPQRGIVLDMDFLERVAEHISFTMERTTIIKDLRHRNEELASTYNAMLEGLSRALELRDLETEGHTRRVTVLTMRLVEHMKIPPEYWDSIKQGALLHDIGKLGIPDAILLKPGSLTPQERKVMEQHTLYGYNILAPIISSRQTLDISLHHHERWDGLGYPSGLKGGQIPLAARLFAVIDVFDALTSDRPYRSAWSYSQAVEYISNQAGRQFDPRVVELFLEIADARN